MTRLKLLVLAFLVFPIAFMLSYAFLGSKERNIYLNQPLPAVTLVNSSGERLTPELLHAGRLVLVFVSPTCRPCQVESEYLRTFVGQKDSPTFLGIISFGEKLASLELSEKIFPFKVFYDEGSELFAKMNIRIVPTKVYLENGIVRKVWRGAAHDIESKKEFSQWIEGASPN
jgi:hypothetical protein